MIKIEIPTNGLAVVIFEQGWWFSTERYDRRNPWGQTSARK
jgi:hypothetical protein